MNRRIVAREVVLNLVHGTDSTHAQATVNNQNINGFEFNGYLQNLWIQVPNCNGSPTVTFNIIDQYGNTIYTKPSIANNQWTQVTPTTPVPVYGPVEFQVVVSVAQTADCVFNVVPVVDQLL
jgi:hypothetical protein